MAVVHPRERWKVLVLDRFPFSRLDFCFFGAKKIGDSQVRVTCGGFDWPVDDD